ncbi:MAG: hypothetical protein ISR77_15850 [Pirellulaceae bacterium]|nr:hypothetical protein [Pirellulaceae bacterium]
MEHVKWFLEWLLKWRRGLIMLKLGLFTALCGLVGGWDAEVYHRATETEGAVGFRLGAADVGSLIIVLIAVVFLVLANMWHNRQATKAANEGHPLAAGDGPNMSRP